MNLTSEQAKALYNDTSFYDCRLILQRFGYALYKDSVSPLGSIVCFEAPTKIGSLELPKALVICGELSNVSMFGGICFQRLFLSQIGSVIGEKIKQECYVNENVLVVGLNQASICLTNRVKESVLFHVVIPIESPTNAFFELKLEEDLLKELKETFIGSFYHLLNSVYKETQRDNF